MMKEELLSRTRRTEEIVCRFLPEEKGWQKTVLSAMNYTMKAGGKRLRPLLMDETYRMYGGQDRDLIEPFMAAIEMIHTYSLIHDDLPALDNDDYRRGRKTAHVIYGEAMAILAGDALLNYAFETASGAFNGTERDIRTARAFQVLAAKPGIYGMIGGQTADVESEGCAISMDKLLFIHKNKTAALIECAMMIGAILAGAPEKEIKMVEAIADKVGVAFQIQDDILDCTASSSQLGKPVGSDKKNEKNTYVSLVGIEQAGLDQKRLTMEAIEAFDQLSGKNDFLKELLLALTGRRY
ncbi:MAG: polyprenyl synthetase family protein [Eubacterium sp.]|nr:polyprenyl synthetase family protein [Eubacterium sp.]